MLTLFNMQPGARSPSNPVFSNGECRFALCTFWHASFRDLAVWRTHSIG